GLPDNTAYWFIPALRTACRQVLAEMPLRGMSGVTALKSRGLDGLCVTVEPYMDEAAALDHLHYFSEQCREAGFRQIFALGVPTLSLATSIGCMGFTVMGGAAVHGATPAPDKSHKFRYAGIFSGGC